MVTRDRHLEAVARIGSGDGCDAVFGSEGEQFFAPLPLADDPSSQIQMSRKDGLTDRRFGADAANGGRRESL